MITFSGLSLLYSQTLPMDKVSSKITDSLSNDEYGLVVVDKESGEDLRMFPLLKPNEALEHWSKLAHVLPPDASLSALNRIDARLKFDQASISSEPPTDVFYWDATRETYTEKVSSAQRPVLTTIKLSGVPEIAISSLDDAGDVIEYCTQNFSKLSSCDLRTAALSVHRFYKQAGVDIQYPDWMRSLLSFRVNSVAEDMIRLRKESAQKYVAAEPIAVKAHAKACDLVIDALSSKDRVKLSSALNILSEVEARAIEEVAHFNHPVHMDVFLPATEKLSSAIPIPVEDGVAAFDTDDPYVYENGGLRLRESMIRGISLLPLRKFLGDFLTSDMIDQLVENPVDAFNGLPSAHKNAIAEMINRSYTSLMANDDTRQLHV
jgi:hypothetical protein